MSASAMHAGARHDRRTHCCKARIIERGGVARAGLDGNLGAERTHFFTASGVLNRVATRQAFP